MRALRESCCHLISIENTCAIFYCQEHMTYLTLDLSDELCLQKIDFANLHPEDCFKLGMYFERQRAVKDKDLLQIHQQNLKKLDVPDSKLLPVILE